jgi:hypothetical protein
MKPPSVTKMDSTAAKMGRSTKKRENTGEPHFDKTVIYRSLNGYGVMAMIEISRVSGP